MTDLFPELDLEVAISDTCPVHDEDQLSTLVLREISKRLHSTRDFPTELIRRCAVLEGRCRPDGPSMIRFYVWLAYGCLTSAFIMTQRNAALRRIESSDNEPLRNRLLPNILSGAWFATVGISQLTTSRRHLSQPPLIAKRTGEGWSLQGYSPWVTGAIAADVIVVGAVEHDGRALDEMPSPESPPQRQLLFAIETDRRGLRCEPGMSLVGLSASCTDRVRVDGLHVRHEQWLHGPAENVLSLVGRHRPSSPASGGAGGLQTSALAIGHAAKAIEYLRTQSEHRAELRSVADKFYAAWQSQFGSLIEFATNGSGDLLAIRKEANDLALQATQSALVAAKGAGYASDHEVGRWCCEALFFLVWSCPQTVIDAHLCSLSSFS